MHRAYKAVPLPHEWMITGVIGFFVAMLLVYPTMSQKWGFALMLFFFIIFCASIVSMSRATTDEEHLNILAVHYKRR